MKSGLDALPLFLLDDLLNKLGIASGLNGKSVVYLTLKCEAICRVSFVEENTSLVSSFSASSCGLSLM